MCSCAFSQTAFMSLSCTFVHAARLLLRSECLLTAELHSDEVLEAQVLQEHSWRSTSLEVEGDVRGELCLQGGEVEVGRLLVERRCVPYRLWKEKTDESLFAVPCLHFINNNKKKQSSEIREWRNLMKHDMWSATSASSVDFWEETGSKLWYLVSKFTPESQSISTSFLGASAMV